MKGHLQVLKGTSLEKFIIDAIEKRYKVKISHPYFEFCYEGSYDAVKEISLSSCDDGCGSEKEKDEEKR